MVSTCDIPTSGRKRVFWSTQICSVRPDRCGADCATFGLKLEPDLCPDAGCDNTRVDGCAVDISMLPRRITNSDWVRGLALNILMTDARNPDSVCGYPPGQRGGHWSESYRSGVKVGSLLRALPRKSSIEQNVQAIKVQAEVDLNKLVTYGVASSVEVTTAYLGGSRYSLNAKIYGSDGITSNVGLSGTRLENAFVWSTGLNG
jgi:phage gp46-like protein